MNKTAFQINTPDYSHLKEEDFENVYKPSEDTFLLIDALEKDLENILKLKPTVCLEVGIGSGVVSTALASVVGKSCKYYGTDVNPIACEKACQTGLKNDVIIETFCTDLVLNVPEEIKGKVDILLFNPPYVETPTNEVGAGNLEFTWAGGNKGREVMDKFFPHISSLLLPSGLFFLVLENKNKPKEVLHILAEQGFSSQLMLFRKCFNESLAIYKFYRDDELKQ